jgi:hypothetical protein
MPSLLDLIATGSVGSVGPGSSPDEVRRKFGEPSDTSVSHDPLVLKFGALEVTVRDGCVELLQVELDQELPPFVDRGDLSDPPKRAEVERSLKRRGVWLEPYDPLTFDDDQVALRAMPSRVVMIFDGDRLVSTSSSAH